MSQEADPQSIIIEEHKRKIAIAEELLIEAALEIAPCTSQDLRDKIELKCYEQDISTALGDVALCRLIDKGELIQEYNLTLSLPDEAQVTADSLRSLDHLI